MDNYKEISSDELLDGEAVGRALFQSVKEKVKKAFGKRGWEESFTEEELAEIEEIDRFLRRVHVHENFTDPDDTAEKYFILAVKGSCEDSYGNSYSIFYHKAVKQSDFYYKQVPLYVAKCIYKLCKEVEVFYAVNSFEVRKSDKGFYAVERKRKNVASAKCLYTDIDLTEDYQKLGNEALLEVLKDEYKDVFTKVPPSYIIRSGGGIHLYYCLFESFSLYGENEEKFKEEGLRPLMKIFEDIGADAHVVDTVRVLRIPNSVNRKPKYGPDGKKVEIIFETDAVYNAEELMTELRLLQNGKMDGLFEEILDELFPTYEDEDTTELEVLQPAQPCDGTLGAEMYSKKENRRETERSKKLKECGYKGLQPSFDANGETFYQNRDLMWYLSNRENHEGVRNSLLIVFIYNWMTQYKITDYDEIFEKAKKLNTYLNPPLEKKELEYYTEQLYKKFETVNGWKFIRNLVLYRWFSFTEEEVDAFIGAYAETQEKVGKLSHKKNNAHTKELLHRSESYRDYIEKQNYYFAVKEYIRNNPMVTYKEIYEMTGVSRDVFRRARKPILDEIKQMKQKARDDKFMAPFFENPDITFKEYKEKYGYGRESYFKYRKKFRERRP